MLVPVDARFTWREIIEFARRSRERAHDFDLVHAELGAGTLHEFHAARLIADDAATPLFVTVHDPPWAVRSPFATRTTRDRRVLRALSTAVLAPIGRRYEFAMLERASGVFTLSRTGLAALARGPAQSLSNRSAVIPYPLAPRRPAAGEPVDPPSDGLTVGFFGHWYAGKGLPTLVRALGLAAADPEPIRARLFGDAWTYGGERTARRHRAQVLSMVAKSPARELIETPGFLDESNLARELRSCDAVVLPYERRRVTQALSSASAALLDVLSTGTPVVASRVRSLEEFVSEGDNGLLVEPGDELDLVSALRRLRDDPDLLSSLAQGARTSAAGRSPELAAQAVIAVYRRTVPVPVRALA